jgi:uncharacterized protein (DUF1800 family)
MKSGNLKRLAGAVLLASLGACGGNNGQADQPAAKTISLSSVYAGSEAPADNTSVLDTLTSSVQRVVLGGTTASAAASTTPAVPAPVTPAQASRFLAQASFGPTDASIADVAVSGPANWIDRQFLLPRTSHRDSVTYVAAKMAAAGEAVTYYQTLESFWRQAITGDDQLRQRVTYALSQIMVVSIVNSEVQPHPAGIAHYYDVLNKNAFGNFRDLIEGVALHPMMGIYLSHMRNQKESGARVPDENFAREIMQLMTIGLYKLNQDGSQQLSNGNPIETYTHEDVVGLAKVFTGWSWAGPDKSSSRFFGSVIDPARDWTFMQNYPAYHSTSDKRFLGTSISGATTGEADLKVALDTLFNHPNVGPFIGRELIQRLVGSNPSPAYISRVAAAFANNGNGVRGDMKAVVRAILLDPEARNAAVPKLREPVLRMSNWMRAFNAQSKTGRFQIGPQDDPLLGFAQTPMRAPSVFNFYRPSYTPPNSSLSSAGLVSPEMQLTSEPSVTGYLNMMQTGIVYGIGLNYDIQPDYKAELALAATPDKLVDRINLLMLNGSMSTKLRNQLITTVTSMPIEPGPWVDVPTNMKRRVWLAIFLAMASPEYLVQR